MKIIVVKNNLSLGVLTEQRKGNILFEYFEGIESKNYLIGLNKKTNESNEGLFPVFENLLPEHEQLQYIKHTQKIKNEIEVLLHLNNIHGSFEFFTEEQHRNFEAKENKTFTYEDVKNKILQQEYTFPNILDDYELDIDDKILYPVEFQNGKVVGLSGYQYKFSVLKDDHTKRIYIDETNDSNYFMKPYNKNYSTFTPDDKSSAYIPYLLINEHLFMTLARDFGFNVPYNAIIKNKIDYHYIIKRYDRYDDLKIDHCEVLTLMGKKSDQKYRVTLKEVGETVSKYLNEKEKLELFKFFIFSIIISHGDLHAKNLSLIYKTNRSNETNMQLAPYYDVSTTGIYKDVDNKDIGMKLKSKNKKIKREDMLWLADFFDINEEIAEESINHIASKFRDEFESYIDKLPNRIQSLPVYKNRQRFFDSLDTVLRKFYKQRVDYIDKYLLVETPKIVEDIWK